MISSPTLHTKFNLKTKSYRLSHVNQVWYRRDTSDFCPYRNAPIPCFNQILSFSNIQMFLSNAYFHKPSKIHFECFQKSLRLLCIAVLKDISSYSQKFLDIFNHCRIRTLFSFFWINMWSNKDNPEYTILPM